MDQSTGWIEAEVERTVTATLALTDGLLALVTVMVQLPGLMPEIKPKPVTLATEGLEVLQISPLLEAFSGSIVTMGI